MKRYVIGPMIGSGTEEDMYRHLACSYPYSGACGAVLTPERGNTRGMALFIGTQAEIDTMAADARLALVPFGPADLDRLWTEVLPRNTDRQNIANRIRAASGVTIARDDTRTVREIITLVGRVYDPGFDPANLDAPDIV